MLQCSEPHTHEQAIGTQPYESNATRTYTLTHQNSHQYHATYMQTRTTRTNTMTALSLHASAFCAFPMCAVAVFEQRFAVWTVLSMCFFSDVLRNVVFIVHLSTDCIDIDIVYLDTQF